MLFYFRGRGPQVKLDTLDLSSNKIASFEGLEQLNQLTDLWVRQREHASPWKADDNTKSICADVYHRYLEAMLQIA